MPRPIKFGEIEGIVEGQWFEGAKNDAHKFHGVGAWYRRNGILALLLSCFLEAMKT